MALIVEDGTGLPTANSYLSVAAADTYYADIGGNAAWSALDNADKEAKLIASCSALEIKYRGKWIGAKAHSVQRLAWPRAAKVDTLTPLYDLDSIAIPVDAVPEAILTAQAEVMAITLSGGSFTTTPIARNDMLKRKKTDVLESEWFEGAPTQTLYPYIDQILYGYASGASSGVPTIDMRLGLSEEEINQGCSDDYLNDPAYFIQG